MLLKSTPEFQRGTHAHTVHRKWLALQAKGKSYTSELAELHACNVHALRFSPEEQMRSSVHPGPTVCPPQTTSAATALQYCETKNLPRTLVARKAAIPLQRLHPEYHEVLRAICSLLAAESRRFAGLLAVNQPQHRSREVHQHPRST